MNFTEALWKLRPHAFVPRNDHPPSADQPFSTCAVCGFGEHIALHQINERET